MGPDGLFHSPGSVAKLFFWANVVVIAENLIPRPVQTSYGNTFTDGWLIWHVLFRWNKPATAGPERIPAWELFVCQILKWSVVLILLIGVLFFAVVAFIPFFDSNAPKIFLGKGLWAVMFIGLALVCGWCCWRVLREPVAKVRKPAVNPRQVADFRAGLTTEQLKMLQNASKLLAEKSYAEASMVLDQLMPATADQSTSAYSQLLLAKVQCLLSLQQIDEAEALCRNYAQREVSSEYKLSVIDGAACFILYQSSSPFLKHAERLARVGLEMAPGALTLKGTLGAILAEQGKHGEAERLLIECLDRIPTLHDRAIATFYLGMIKMRTGATKEGKRLTRRGMKMYPEDWIVAKGNTLLKEV